MKQDAIILNAIAKTMNAGGSAIVTAFDAGAAAFNCTMSALSPGERTKLAGRIKAYETKIRALHVEIAKETAKYADLAAALESETVKTIHAAIKELNTQIELLKGRISEIDKSRSINKPTQESGNVATIIVNSITGLLPGEKASIQRKIHVNEKKIQELYCDFAKETAKQPNPQDAINSEAVVAIFSKIKELKTENDSLRLGNQVPAEIKAAKPKSTEVAKPVEKKQQESAGVARFFMHAISDSISKYLPIQKPHTDESVDSKKPEVAKRNENTPEPAGTTSVAESGTNFSDNSLEVNASGSNGQSDMAAVGYSRTKSCQISTPTMQPPTRDDIEKAAGVKQVETNQDIQPNERLEEHAGTALSASVINEVTIHREGDTDIAKIDSSANAIDEESHPIPAAEEALDSGVLAASSSETPETPMEPAPELSAVDSAETANEHLKYEVPPDSDGPINSLIEEPVLEIPVVEDYPIVSEAVHVESSDIPEEMAGGVVPVNEEINFSTEVADNQGDDPIQIVATQNDDANYRQQSHAMSSQGEPETSPEPVVELSTTDVAETTEAHDTNVETYSNSEVSSSITEAPLPESVVVDASPIATGVHDETIMATEELKNESALAPENINLVKEEEPPQHDNLGIFVKPMHGFENTRTRTQVTLFPAIPEYSHSSASIIPNEAAFRDGSGPVFRTRAHRDIAPISETISTEVDTVSNIETSTVKVDAPPLQNGMSELIVESGPIFRAKQLQTIVPVVNTVKEPTPKDNSHINTQKPVKKKPVQTPKHASGKTTSQQKKNSDQVVGSKRNLLPKGVVSSSKPGKSQPKKRG